MRSRRMIRGEIAVSLLTAPLGGCTAFTPRCGDARDYHADLRPCCLGHIRQLVRDAGAAMTAHGVTWWADYGTLLGAVRNPLVGLAPGIIPHDKDADLGCLFTDWQRLMVVRAALERQGYDVHVRAGGQKMKVRLSAVNHTNVDIFAWRARRDGSHYRVRYIGVDRFKGRDIPPGRLFPLTTVPWEGLTIPAPADPVAFCAFRYGPGWATPLRANHDGVPR